MVVRISGLGAGGSGTWADGEILTATNLVDTMNVAGNKKTFDFLGNFTHFTTNSFDTSTYSGGTTTLGGAEARVKANDSGGKAAITYNKSTDIAHNPKMSTVVQTLSPFGTGGSADYFLGWADRANVDPDTGSMFAGLFFSGTQWKLISKDGVSATEGGSVQGPTSSNVLNTHIALEFVGGSMNYYFNGSLTDTATATMPGAGSTLQPMIWVKARKDGINTFFGVGPWTFVHNAGSNPQI